MLIKIIVGLTLYDSDVWFLLQLSDAERLVRLRDEDRILIYEIEKPAQSAGDLAPPNQYGFLYHRIGSTLVGDPLLFTFNSKTTCTA